MLMQNFGVTNKEYYGMLWYFLEWSIDLNFDHALKYKISALSCLEAFRRGVLSP